MQDRAGQGRSAQDRGSWQGQQSQTPEGQRVPPQGQVALTGPNSRKQEGAEGQGRCTPRHRESSFWGQRAQGQMSPGELAFLRHVWLSRTFFLLLLQQELGLHSRFLGEPHQEPGAGALVCRGENNLPDLPKK